MKINLTREQFVKYGTRTAILLLVSAPLLVFADDTFVPLTSLPGIPQAGNAPSLPIFLRDIYGLAIGAAAVVAVLQLMRAGFTMITSQGSALSNKESKERISNALIGLVLVLSPYIVFSIINPDILKLDFANDFGGLQLTTLTKTPTTAGGAASTQQVQLAYFFASKNNTSGAACIFQFTRVYNDTASCQADEVNIKKLPPNQGYNFTAISGYVFDRECTLVQVAMATYKPSSSLPSCN
jgi:hypothetical protein